PVCGSRDRRELGRPGRMSPTFQRFARELETVRTVRCSGCTSLYVAPMVHLSDALQAEVYNIDYFRSANGVRDLKNMKEKETVLDIVARIHGPLADKALLDVGCGT